MKAYATVPLLSIAIDDVAISNEIIQTIHSIRIKQILSAPSQCEIVLPQAHEKFSSEMLSKISSLLKIKIHNHPQALFHGQITSIDYLYDAALMPLLVIRAYDLLHQLKKRQPVRTHVQVNMYKLAQELTKDLSVVIQGEDGPTLTPKLFQFKQSDLQLLYEFGEKNDQYFFLNDNQLSIFSLEGNGQVEALILGKNLFEARLVVNAETTTESVIATGWNMQEASSYVSSLQKAEVKNYSDSLFNSSNFKSDGQRTLVDCVAGDKGQSELIVRNTLSRLLKQQMTVWGVAEGNPALMPGVCVQLSGVVSALTNSYVLTEVTHTIDPSKGYLSEINSSPPPPHVEKNHRINNATIGIVTQVDDPDGHGRVKVSLPSYNDVETEWLQVVCAGAGANKGQLVLPDIGDNVLLLIVNGEPAQSIVLGGLYGQQDLPFSVIEDGTVKRYITQTADKQSIILDDHEQSVKLQTKNGHSVYLAPKKIDITHKNGSCISLADDLMTIHSKTDLKIEAPGCSIIFRGKKIDFEEA